jgi:hypothetical protein
MTLLIFDKHPLVIDKKLAKIIGLNQAMILQQVHYWLELNKKNKINFHEGKHWTYNTINEWQEEFPFWSKETIKRAFNKLRDLGIIQVGNFNVYKMDRTLWYTIDYEKLNECIRSNSLDGDVENEPMEKDLMSPAIPETSSETTTEIYNLSVNQVKEGKDIQETREKKQTDRLNDKNNKLKDEYEKIIDKCEFFAIDENYRNAVAHGIRLLLLDLENKQRLKIGDNYYPIETVREDLKKIDFHIVQHAVNKFKEASENNEIRNPIAYLKACIYNAIYEMNIEVDSRLRFAGLI